MCEFKTMEIYESPKKQQNEEKYGINENSCECCMKPIQNIKYWIHMTTSYKACNTIDEDILKQNGTESQGFFPIGNNCAKRFKKEFLFT